MATPGRVPPKPAAKPKPGGLSNALTSAPILKAGTPPVPDTQTFAAPSGGLRPGTPSLIAPRPAFGPPPLRFNPAWFPGFRHTGPLNGGYGTGRLGGLSRALGNVYSSFNPTEFANRPPGTFYM